MNQMVLKDDWQHTSEILSNALEITKTIVVMKTKSVHFRESLLVSLFAFSEG